ncbi:MAG: hypothetical protein KZQ78_15260 [Candidatus Thiodiazotropha sp. (ex Ustalcina ferruginea)]|nr:hypothetical protein [Candidatus Thiodiazotropha sp. (ex Ustalcina ferruginea)]
MAPSFKLQEVFKYFHHEYKKAGFDVNACKPPEEVMDVFDRMLATDEEIAKKKKYDWEAERLKLDAVFGKSNKPKGIKGKLNSTSRNTRIIISVSVVWLIWVVFRTSGRYELLGPSRLYSWDDDMFFANAIVPILAGIVLFKAYKWINGAKNSELIVQ